VRLHPDHATLLIEETIENVGSAKVDFLLGHHPTFPAIPGAKIDVAAGAVHVEAAAPGMLSGESSQWPVASRLDGTLENLATVPDEVQMRVLYLEAVAAGWVAMRPPLGSTAPGIALSWDVTTFPNLWFWLQNGDNAYPWWGRARLIGLEPQRAWPFDGLAAARDRGQSISLEPGLSHSTWITLTRLDRTDIPVESVDRNGGVSFGSAE
jgi:galactose mutarotase-like enzyme